MELFRLTAALHNKTVIGVSGHRDISPDMEAVIKAKLYDKLKELKGNDTNTILLTCLASGADQLAAEAALDAGIPFIVVLPMRKEYYNHDFHENNELSRFNQLFGKKRDSIVTDETSIEKNDHERNIQYKNAGHLIVTCSDHVLAIWDGVYTGECGGTSEIVQIALSGVPISDTHLSSFRKKSSASLHHLVTPRICNPFPVTDPKISILPLSEMEWANASIPLPGIKQPGTLKGFFRRYKEFLIKFVIPLLLVLVTLIFGYTGFRDYESKYNRMDAFFAAANLITLGNSVLDNHAPIPFPLQLARITGLLTAIYAIAGAFLWAASDLRKRAVIFFWGRNFYLVIGLNEKSFNLVKDLRSRKIKTVVLNDDANSPLIKSSQYLGAVVYYGNPAELADLNNVYFKKAKKIYVFTESDTQNLRIKKEIDEHAVQHTKSNGRSFYACINDSIQKEFLARSTPSGVSVFNIHENTARWLLLKHPIDRFQYTYYSSAEEKLVQVILIGFDKVAWELAISILRMGHYTNGTSLELLIFTEGDEQKLRSEIFKEKYGRIFCSTTGSGKEDTFSQHSCATVKFEVLPESNAALTDPVNSVFFRSISTLKGASVNIFTCLSDRLKSAACLSLLLPRLDFVKTTRFLNIQVFCYYNSPDESEEAYIEHQLNKMGTHIPVYCFGNYMKVCTEEVISNNIVVQLARQLAFWYYLIHSFNDDTSELKDRIYKTYNEQVFRIKGKDMFNWMKETTSYLQRSDTLIEARIRTARELLDLFWQKEPVTEVKNWWNKCWMQLPENEKESNQHAADHIFVKLRCIGKSFVEMKSVHDLGADHIELLSSVEHRRWCTEKLIEGWHPFNDIDDWLTRGTKAVLKKLKLHYDIRDFEKMDQVEKNKNHNQIIGIPYFLNALQIK